MFLTMGAWSCVLHFLLFLKPVVCFSGDSMSAVAWTSYLYIYFALNYALRNWRKCQFLHYNAAHCDGCPSWDPMCFLLPWKNTGIARFFSINFPGDGIGFLLVAFTATLSHQQEKERKEDQGGIEFLQNEWVFRPTCFKKQFLVQDY